MPAGLQDGKLASKPSDRHARLLTCQLAGQTACRLAGMPVRQQAFRKACLTTSMTLCLPADMQSCYRWTMIIVVANSKGGVGKSTLAVHLAAWLSKQGHRLTL